MNNNTQMAVSNSGEHRKRRLGRTRGTVPHNPKFLNYVRARGGNTSTYRRTNTPSNRLAQFATRIQKHIRGRYTRKKLAGIKNIDPITLSPSRGKKIVRIRRSQGIYNYFNLPGLNNYSRFVGFPLNFTRHNHVMTGILHPLTRIPIYFNNMTLMNNPFRV